MFTRQWKMFYAGTWEVNASIVHSHGVILVPSTPIENIYVKFNK